MMSAEIVPFASRQSKAAQPASLHRSLGFQDFSAACRKLAESLRDLTMATRHAAAQLQMVKDGADAAVAVAVVDDIHQLDRLHAEFVRNGKR
ncbi:MAG TPA: hypothetical protein VM689_15020 [Aliidongia sp.]|nr:hypothetical protein [Aliidongia sp.]